MSFDEQFYKGGMGYSNYRDFPHFARRASWIAGKYKDKAFKGSIWIVGCGWGFVVKHLRDLLPVEQQQLVKGLTFSQYEYEQSVNVVGLPPDSIEVSDAADKFFPQMDMAISWNFLDCLPPSDEEKAIAICSKLSTMARYQIHVICMSDNDINAELYIKDGYNIKSLEYWQRKFDLVKPPEQEIFLVDYGTNTVSKKTVEGWIPEKNFLLPTSWKRTSE